MQNLRDKLIEVYDRVHRAEKKAQRPTGCVQLVAVSKTQPATAIRELYGAGQRAFGENYLQEALAKQAELADLAIEWHFIGPIQSNKTQAIASHFHWVHSVDRAKVAERLAAQRPASLPPLNICLQVNLDAEASKSGVAPEQLLALAEKVLALPNLCLRGLMAIPAPRDNDAEQLAVFSQMRELLMQLQRQLAAPSVDTRFLDTLSMGMSADMDAAIAAGATMVRIGTDLFGARPA